ncbi:MAG: hypothetical protein JW745_08555 [Sedimentisphaerales bacterium]|nr:hypothetical protein [Sedimentisphaerales bacterium]
MSGLAGLFVWAALVITWWWLWLLYGGGRYFAFIELVIVTVHTVNSNKKQEIRNKLRFRLRRGLFKQALPAK